MRIKLRICKQALREEGLVGGLFQGAEGFPCFKAGRRGFWRGGGLVVCVYYFTVFFSEALHVTTEPQGDNQCNTSFMCKFRQYYDT